MVSCASCRGTNDDLTAACTFCGQPLEGRSWWRRALGAFSSGNSNRTGEPVKRDFLTMLTTLAAQRLMQRGQILETLEEALVSAIKKDNPEMGPNISVKLDSATGKVAVYTLKTVVESVEDPARQITLADARLIEQHANLGDEVTAAEQLPKNVSAGAVQAAKRVVLQRLRDTERGRKDV